MARRTATLRAAPRAAPYARAAFDIRHIADAPARAGVYLLYRDQRLIYIGLAPRGLTIREELLRHLRGGGGACTRSATHFDCEASAAPVALYDHYVAVYLDAAGGVLPDCNEAPPQ
jgi:hypothetical protein